MVSLLFLREQDLPGLGLENIPGKAANNAFQLVCQIKLQYKKKFVVTGAFLDYLSVKILKLRPMYFDLKKIEWKK